VCRHASERITKRVKRKDTEDAVMMANEMNRFWKVYDVKFGEAI